ncbi:acyl-CoA/acyl-ACP dehydrogenase (plasmid) [Mesorhizobium mediterraneum]|uniref:Acyl-CoA dehydrogenase n=1 Tax=Mesorhizobium mediterraneum TaxID=43617 RepID=A0AB36R1T1_9HYPH|nr:acyl-CoA dehydrogenase family protein [Mesorhizobium mediterraneum]PAP98654.1 acyl-CoA dehydrogenase [Mesorhizobium mediterraneum]RWN29525.1 MAG: acyl-CoA dehydrogenase [Mesorhizobium sp.]WIW57007.1 acyl-CoA/acyl-ACP dehydrogenase [Mesorhizobium mediterraneum]
MRDFFLTHEDRAFRAEVRTFMSRELAPKVNLIERDQDFSAQLALVRVLGQAGYLKLMFPDLYRGALPKPGLTHAVIVSEEAAYLNYAFETTIATALSCAYPIHRFARESLRERYLLPILEGRSLGSVCMTEPSVGSDSAGMETRIRFDEEAGEWVVSGVKRYISNASKANVYIVWGVTDPDLPPQKGLTAVLIPAHAKGLTFPRLYDFVGRRGSIVGEVAMDEVRVPGENLLGEVNGGFNIMLSAFNFERVILGGSGLGVARAAFDIACQHAQSRVSFGQKLGQKQLIWDMIAQMSWKIDAAELLTHRAAKMYDSGIGGKDLMREASQAKLVATETAVFCADRTVQILGGDGVTRQYGKAEQLYRDARTLPIVGGTSEMCKYLIASREMPSLRLNL